MSSLTLIEKLQLKEERNLLIQGLPSSIEKQFIKLSFAKNLTPLLKSRRIDFALVFAVSQQQLQGILKEVLPSLQPEAKLWIAYPKRTSKIASDLSRDASWDFIADYGYESVRSIAMDNVWSAVRFIKPLEGADKRPASFSSSNPAPGVDYKNRTVEVPSELQTLLEENEPAAAFFQSLAFSHRREYVEWIASAKREETRARRLETTMEKLTAGKKNFNDK
ncbi:MAG: YdeI/OmpD-associated family protein [Chitinophagaceae bacterium]|nr:YdeI/OmpD-associated family protein [Chitinophagaceae bacterium]MBL0056954.1 YdeI/OmpD-associated family protein [Chitinophagaceae bacterium]